MSSRTKKLRTLVATYWQPTVFYGMLIVFFGLLLWFRLGSLTGGYSASEWATQQAGQGLRHIFEHPLNAPFTMVAYLFGLIFGHDNLIAFRAAATAYGLLTLTTFYWLVRHWHGERSAILGTVVFGCSAWFLHVARLGTPEALLYIPLVLTAGGVWLKHTDNRAVLIGGFALAAALLYMPGMIWFVIVVALWQARNIGRLFKKHLALMLGGAALMLALLAPLGLAIYRSPELAKVIAGLPAKGWPDPIDSLTRLAHIPYNLVLRGPLMPEHWLGRLAILDAFGIAMLTLGVYLYTRHPKLLRSRMIAVALIVGTVLASLGGGVSISVLMPFVYVLVAAGIGFMLDRWQQVFPRNVIAQTVSAAFMSLAVIASAWYGFRHYFVAWPEAPTTKQVFVIKE